jgi:A/G-specific adenine glycosylase
MPAMRPTALDKRLSPEAVSAFRKTVYDYYEKHGRNLPWRRTSNPYYIFVSEVMLQQTQVERVMEKYDRFVRVFPDFSSLARASVRDVITEWQGLGYNRRALALLHSAQIIISIHGGALPGTVEELSRLPGIGKTTAGEILAFAFNAPAIFIETNIRRVYIHHFFQDQVGVRDMAILPLVESTLDRAAPRAWYYALMDYGSMLKKFTVNPNRKSAHYQRQPPFESSNRRLRGLILKTLLTQAPLGYLDLAQSMGDAPERVKGILDQLSAEGLVKEESGLYVIP